MAGSETAVAVFPPPPRFYEEFEPHSTAGWEPPAPPPPLEGPYVMYGIRYDTAFAPQDPGAAHRDRLLDIDVQQESPVATLRLLNRLLPEEYLKLMRLMIDRPVLCLNEGHRQKIRDIDVQRERVESIIAAMHLTLSRFRPYQARQALITTLRAQVDRRRKEAKELRECRERAQALIQKAARQLKDAKDALATQEAAEVSAEQALAAASKSTATGAVSATPLVPPRDVSQGSCARAETAECSEPSLQGASSSAKRRRTASLEQELDAIPRDL